jgi:hypothetical protein
VLNTNVEILDERYDDIPVDAAYLIDQILSGCYGARMIHTIYLAYDEQKRSKAWLAVGERAYLATNNKGVSPIGGLWSQLCASYPNIPIKDAKNGERLYSYDIQRAQELIDAFEILVANYDLFVDEYCWISSESSDE